MARKSSRESLDPGVSAAIWASDRPVEIWGSADLSIDVLSMALPTYCCEAWVDQLRLRGLIFPTQSRCPICISRMIASVAPGALELNDPLARSDPDITNTCHWLARKRTPDGTMSQLHFDALTMSIAVQIVRRRWSNSGAKATPFMAGLPPARLRLVEEFFWRISPLISGSTP